MVERCKVCTLPSNMPGIRFDDDGVCNHCQSFDYEEFLANQGKALESLKSTVEEALALREKGENDYDCVVALSGGKDSCYTLRYLAGELELNCLAITVDNGYLSPQSIVNSRIICEEVGADFVLWKPNSVFYRSLYRKSLEGKSVGGAIVRASDICNSCINLINSVMLKEALNRNIPLIAGGYIAGQVPKDTCVLKLSLKGIANFSKIKDQAKEPIFSFRHYKPGKADIERFTITNHVAILNPLLALTYDEGHIVKELSALGWARPNDTGAHSSNCQINDLGIKNHLAKYGFHPYEMEIAEQVRSRTLTREQALGKIEAELDTNRINAIELDLAEHNES